MTRIWCYLQCVPYWYTRRPAIFGQVSTKSSSAWSRLSLSASVQRLQNTINHRRCSFQSHISRHRLIARGNLNYLATMRNCTPVGARPPICLPIRSCCRLDDRSMSTVRVQSSAWAHSGMYFGPSHHLFLYVSNTMRDHLWLIFPGGRQSLWLDEILFHA